jgi:hypothetical protein
MFNLRGTNQASSGSCSNNADKRARFCGESLATAAARASTVPSCSVSPLLVQAVVQASEGLAVSPCRFSLGLTIPLLGTLGIPIHAEGKERVDEGEAIRDL